MKAKHIYFSFAGDRKMTKTVTSISIDYDLLMDFRREFPEKTVSEIVSRALTDMINTKGLDKKEVSKRLLKLKIEKKEEEISILASELRQEKTLLSEIENEQKEIEIIKLKEQAKIKETKTKCLSCGNVCNHDGDGHKFPNGLVCNNCFMTKSNRDKWGS